MNFLKEMKSGIVIIVVLFSILYQSFCDITGTKGLIAFAKTVISDPTITVDYEKELNDNELEKSMLERAKRVATNYKQTGNESPIENFSYETDKNGIRITGYSGVETKVVIPAVIDKKPVVTIDAACFKSNIYLAEVVIPDTVVYIEESAFYECSNLEYVEIPKYCVTIGTACFSKDTALKTVTKRADTDGKVYSVKTICNDAFSNCTSLSEVHLPGSGFNEVRIEPNAFINCTALTIVELPDNVKSILDNAFYKCSKLTDITGLESAIEIGCSAFGACSSLTEVSFSGDIKYIGSYAFDGCTSLAVINFKERSVAKDEEGKMIMTDIDSGCFKNTAITEIEIPGYVKVISDSCFENCTKLTSFKWNDSGQNQATQWYGNAIFNGCSSLTDVYLPITVGNASEFTYGKINFAIHTNSQSVRAYCDQNQIPYDDWK